MARVTSSSDRAKRQARSSAVVRSSQGRPNRQRASTANVTNSERRPSGGTARVTSSGGGDSKRLALPPKGGTSAGGVKATAQRTATAVTQKVKQDIAVTRALADNMQRNQARDARKIPADPSPKVRYVPPGGSNVQRKALPTGKPGGAVVKAGSSAVTKAGSGQKALPPGRQGGAATSSPRGAVANREAPRPRPGGRVVVDESPRLPGGRQGGALANRSGDWGTFFRNTASRSGSNSAASVRTGQPGADRRAMPPGKPGGPAVSGGARPSGGGASAAAKVAGGGLRAGLAGKGNLATAALIGIQGAIASTDTKWGASVRRDMKEEQDFKNGIIQRWTKGANVGDGRGRNFNRPDSTTSGRTGRGGTTADRELAKAAAAKAKDKKSGTRGPGVPSRLLQQAQQQQNDQPQRPQTGPQRSAAPRSGSTPSYRSSSPTTPAASQRGTAAPSSGQSGASRTWEQFNPGRGTSNTNNPLIKNDAWLMGRIKNREDTQRAESSSQVKSKFSLEDNKVTEGLKVSDASKAAGDAAKANFDKLTEEQKKRLRDRVNGN